MALVKCIDCGNFFSERRHQDCPKCNPQKAAPKEPGKPFSELTEDEKNEVAAKGCCGGCLVLLIAPLLMGILTQLSGYEYKASCPSTVDLRRAMNYQPRLFKRYTTGSEYKHCR